ncbi:unnamed protein product [Periconia digitata]|uniref:Spindle pole body component n=1 Tax=Periconia digitata TaxID=1303443 RepID=A0A9W4U5K1_9PLEO|nr:unnamed protein product [Periconia digitata]
MLHEILLSLSGHPSALFDSAPSHATSTPKHVDLLSPPETELLSSLGHLSRVHRRLRHHVARLAASHPSTVARAVATAITSYHLDRFQQKILDVESRILKQDASTVGAYNIVPLATLVGEFSEWTRVMEWLWDISNFILPSEASKKGDEPVGKACSGAELIDKLRAEAQTGYPDIEEAALHLSTVAESAWLRQLATWLLHGRLPSFGASDFFIEDDSSDELSFIVQHALLPKFVTRDTASSILFIGKSLNQIRSLPSTARTLASETSGPSELELLPIHVGYLSEVNAPISSAKLSEVIAKIRVSLSRNLLQHLLPRERIVDILFVLHQFFLLGRGEFAMTLIAEADERLRSRHRMPVPSKQSGGIQGVLLKEAEISQTLSRSFNVLSTLSGEDDHTDDILDLAIDTLHLVVYNPASHRPGTPGRAKDSTSILPQIANVAFNNLLLSIPTVLTMDIKSPLDLFMSRTDLEVYTNINAYLLALRRAHLHLAQLWRHSSLRREHPTPPGYQYSNIPQGKAILKRRRQRNNARARELRKVWATCAAAIFFLAESEAYFQGEVVQESFKHFLHWIENPVTTASSTSARPPSSSAPVSKQPPTSASATSSAALAPTSSKTTQQTQPHQHDPEALSLAHRTFLRTITLSLLLTDSQFTTLLHTTYTHIDLLTAHLTRLQTIHASLDAEEDDGFEDYSRDWAKEQKEVSVELDRARRRLDADLKGLVGRLRDIDGERLGAWGTKEDGGAGGDEGMYVPLRLGSVDRLLMKLDWGAGEEEDDVDANEVELLIR